jgi:hypothetical protein
MKESAHRRWEHPQLSSSASVDPITHVTIFVPENVATFDPVQACGRIRLLRSL